jgi:hypothetical protein
MLDTLASFVVKDFWICWQSYAEKIEILLCYIRIFIMLDTLASFVGKYFWICWRRYIKNDF